jgi:ABC-type arginine/histidine transport system permease subunit
MNTRWKWIFGICGSLIVAALGSGLWSVVFAPLGGTILKAFLSLVTLGISSARDSIYSSAARGFWERPSVLLLAFVATLILLFPLYFWLRIWLSRPAASNWLSQKRRLFFWVLLLETFLCAVVFVQLTMASYTNRVIASFHQSLAIISPHISQEERNVLLARFAKIKPETSSSSYLVNWIPSRAHMGKKGANSHRGNT